jgi:pimeloyl-ACP methyl ester carboxylesterase
LSVVELSPEKITVKGYQGVGINVWDYGGDGQPLILCHCTGTHARIWDPIAALLKDQFRILAPDTRGHGNSEKPDDLDAYTWKNSGYDLFNVIQHFGLKDVRAAGHSAGAAQICYCELFKPGTFENTVLIDPVIGPPSNHDGPSPLAEGARKRRETFASFEEAIERFASKLPLNSWTRDTLEAYVHFGFTSIDDGNNIQLKCPGRIEGTIYDKGGSPDVFERLEELTFPVALITGDRSDLKPLAEMQKKRFPNVEYMEMPNASHFIPQECPQEIANIISDKLKYT